MHKIGDNILYGMSGIMTIVDIRNECLTDEEKTYYILCEYERLSSSLTYVPMDNEKLLSAMHPLLTAEEVTAAISEAKSLPDIEWMPDSRARAEFYRGIMRSANRREAMVMIRTIHNTGLRRAAIGKKNFLTDENIMRKAESVLSLEISISLGISQAEAQEMINREIKGVAAR